MKLHSLTTIQKVLFISSFIIIFIIGGVIGSLSILKDEAIETHLKIAKLHSETLAEHISQTFDNIDLTIDSLNTILNNIEDINLLENEFKNILTKNSYIRSINFLDEHKRVIYSSNLSNLTLYLDTTDFYPKPFFNKHILQFGNPWIGRDLIDGIEVTKADDISKSASTFLPVLKMINLNQKEFYILININSEYFINKYIDNLTEEFATFNLIRVDNTILFSSNENITIGSKIKNSHLIEKVLNSGKSSGIDIFKEQKYMSAYYLTDIYPLNIAINLDFDKNLIQWERKRTTILFIITSLVLVSILLVLILMYRNHIEKENEIAFHKKQKESNEKFQILFQQSNFLAAVLKADGSIIEMNNLALNFLGKNISDIQNKRFWDLACWDIEDKIWIRKQIQHFKDDSKIHKELSPLDLEKKKKTIEFILTSININDEIELVALGIDITQKKDREEKLKHAYVVFQNTHDGIMITDSHANIINVNKAFTISTGYKFSEIYMQNPRVLNSGIYEKSFYKIMWEDLLKTGFWEGELINRKKDGTLYNEWLTINCVYDDEGNIKNYIGVFSDTTKQKKQEKILIEQQNLLQQQSKLAAMGEMIENIAHQWRQPLSVISTIATSMHIQKELGINKNSDDIENLNSINNSVQYLSKTIDDFRDFLRTDKIKSKFELKEALEKSLNLISSKLKTKDIIIIKKLEELIVEGIENEIIQVLMNILSNSKDAFEDKKIEKKLIFIDIFKQEDNAIILIKDNAGGINNEIIDRIFEPYFTTKHKSQGTGIGLYMSQEIINNHMNGSLSCFNTIYKYDSKEYKGATFKIILPLI